ncbi:alpha/beta hydrolase family protein [Roseomonas fluvialis]|uniref:Dienelactone hydrolase n=1 Tax=Roseomonas fluvialis TaxID=1750527 RepID=A0ABM7Y7Q2_9PROT|nr:prolyl oligopeptidase family serine peptidase [Roseomonas fluvialis]BDG74011.1 dienelactone hydrolase [Roseomonas fluvialis]
MKIARVLLLGVLLLLAGKSGATSVGFTTLHVPDGAEPALEVAVWYPSDAPSRSAAVGLFMQDVAPQAAVLGRGHPLVVISHGNGGNFASHADTALALAQAGFVVAAPTHTGDNHRDQSRATDVAGRSRGLAAVLDYMVSHWVPGTIDPARIGAFGFSAGGFTVLTTAGGVPDLARIAPHCEANPAFYDCRLMASARRDGQIAAAGTSAMNRPSFIRDGRLRAIVVAAPAFGFTFTPAGMMSVTLPVQLWQAEDDVILPPRVYAEPVRAALPRPPEVHAVAGAGHFDFLGPCPDALARAAPAICQSAPGFDRGAFIRHFNAEVVAFFTRTLAP